MSSEPLEVLEATLDERVIVRLKTGEEIRGTLRGYDQHMNLVIGIASSGSEHGDGATASDEDTTVIRGDNIVTITT